MHRWGWLTVYLAVTDLKVFCRDVRALLLTLLGPLILTGLLVLGLAPRLQGRSLVEPFTVAVVNQDGTPLTRIFLSQLAEDQAVAPLITLVQTEHQQAVALLAQDQVAAAVVIPPDFVAGLERGESRRFTVMANPSRPLQAAITRNLVQSVQLRIAAAQGGIAAVAHYLRRPEVPPAVREQVLTRALGAFSLHALGRGPGVNTAVVSATPGLEPVPYTLVAGGVAAVMVAGLAALHTGGGSVAAVHRRLWACGLSPGQVVVARTLALTTLQMGQMLALGAPLALLLPHLAPAMRPGWLQTAAALGVLVATAGAWAGFLVLVEALFSQSGAANWAALSGAVAFSLAGGSLVPVPYLPPLLQTAGVASINRWAITGLTGSLFDLNPAAALGTALGSAAVLGAMALVLVALAALAAWRLAPLQR